MNAPFLGPFSPAPGLRMGAWRLVERLGAGGFGDAWRVTGPGGEEGVLKILAEADSEVPAGRPIAIIGKKADEDISALMAQFAAMTAGGAAPAAEAAAPAAASTAPTAAPAPAGCGEQAANNSSTR